MPPYADRGSLGYDSFMETKREFLRHTVATLAYRAGKVLRETPERFATTKLHESSRTPLEVLTHVGDLVNWAHQLADGKRGWNTENPESWDAEVARFFDVIARFDARLASDAPLSCAPETLFQGPIADALTHVGQIAMLRRIAGLPVRGENYFRADIVTGRVGREQTAPKFEFD